MTIPSEPGRPQFNRSIAPGFENVAVVIWRRLFTRIDDAKSKIEGPYVQVVESRSSLRLDDRYLGRWRTGTLHTTALNAAVDSLITVKTILEPVARGDAALPMSGLYPMLRAAIESGALAVYLLHPEERDERLRRSYWVADEDANYLDKFSRSMVRPAAARNDAQAEIRELIATRPSLGDPAAFAFRPIRHSDLVESADAVMAADPATPAAMQRMALLSWWQLLSGLSHGKQWAFVESMERSEAIVDEANESAQVRLASSVSAVALALQHAVETLEAALRLFGHRSKDAWAQVEDASEPPAVSYTELRGHLTTAGTIAATSEPSTS